MAAGWFDLPRRGEGFAGVVQLFLPKWFYDDFPTSATPWVSLLPPYNEHLMRDVGALTLAYVVVLTVAAVTMNRALVRTALVANLVFTVPHFVFHATHLENFPTGSAIAQTIALGVGVLLPAALLLLSLIEGRTRQPNEVDRVITD